MRLLAAALPAVPGACVSELPVACHVSLGAGATTCAFTTSADGCLSPTAPSLFGCTTCRCGRQASSVRSSLLLHADGCPWSSDASTHADRADSTCRPAPIALTSSCLRRLRRLQLQVPGYLRPAVALPMHGVSTLKLHIPQEPPRHPTALCRCQQGTWRSLHNYGRAVVCRHRTAQGG